MNDGKRNDQTDFQAIYDGVSFDEPQAAAAFRRLAEKFYRNNFGTASKSEIELEMFDIFEEAAKRSCVNEPVSDFFLAKSLGITPQVVRNRRTKLVLMNPQKAQDWVSILLKVLLDKTYVLRDAKSGCEMKMMLPDRISVYELEDILIRHGHLFDGSFNSLIVVVPMSSVLDILFQEVGRVKCPNGAEEQTVFGFLRWKLSKNEFDEDARDAIETLWGNEAKQKAMRSLKAVAPELTKIGANVLTDSLTIKGTATISSAFARVLSCLGASLKESLAGISREKTEQLEQVSKQLDTYSLIFKQLGNFKDLPIVESSLSADDYEEYKRSS